jgi:hypothetical protein
LTEYLRECGYRVFEAAHADEGAGRKLMAGMRRREVLGALGGAAVAWPKVAIAQPAMPVVGFLNSASPVGYASSPPRGLAMSGNFSEALNLTFACLMIANPHQQQAIMQ